MNTAITVQEWIFAAQYLTSAAFVQGVTFMVHIMMPNNQGA